MARAESWRDAAAGIGPTIVGGSKKHGGADLGPTRAKRAWLDLRVDGMGLADAAPTRRTSVKHLPRLTNEMVASSRAGRRGDDGTSPVGRRPSIARSAMPFRLQLLGQSARAFGERSFRLSERLGRDPQDRAV